MNGVLHLSPPYTKAIIDQDDVVADVESSPLYLGSLPIRLAVQFNIDSSTSGTASFIDGVLASGTVTITDYTAAAGAVVTVAGHALTEGVNWTAATSNNATAISLATAINALTEVNAAAPGAAIITVKAATVGTAGNSITTTKTGSGVTVQQAALAGGLNSKVDGTAHTITITAHGYSTGLKVNYDKLAGTTITNLVDNTDYYVIKVDADTIKLATSLVNAEAGTAISISDANDAVGGGSFTLTPAAIDVDVKVYGTNDNVEELASADIHWVEVAHQDTMNGSVPYVYSNPTVTFAFLKVLVSPQGGTEVKASVLVHTKF